VELEYRGQLAGIAFCPDWFTWMLVPSQSPCEAGEGQGEKEKQEKSGAARLVLKELGKTAPGKEAAVGCGFCICPRELG